MKELSLKQQTLSGVIWTLADNVGIRAFSFVSMLLLARWLGPEEFGLVGMIAVFISLGQTLVISGMTTSLIRTQNASEKDYSTVFFINLVMSVLIYVIIYLVAPYIALFYNEQILTELIRVYCIIFMLTAFSAVEQAILTKQLAFKKLTLLSVPSTLIGIIIGLVMGYNGFGVWSIVWLYLSTEIIRTVLLWVFAEWRPKFLFSIEKFKIHYRFGYKLMLSTILDTIFQNIYNILIGKYFSAKSLGYFERSKRFSEYPSASLTGIILKVTYPLLSKLQDDKKRLEDVYRKLLRVSFFIIAPIMLGTAVLAKPLFELILGQEWLPAVVFFQILCIAMMLYPVHAFNLNVLNVFGRSDLFLKVELIKKGIIIISIIVAFQFGILGLVWSNVFTSFAALGVNMYFSSKIIRYPIKTQITDLAVILFLTFFMVLIMYGMLRYLKDTNLILQLLIPGLMGILFYSIINYANKRSPMHDAINLLRTRNQ